MRILKECFYQAAYDTASRHAIVSALLICEMTIDTRDFHCE